ncbi:MAG TPA: MaoC family dehydratase [Polyangia bacterium]|nr:MaoC family dehydratase [Polyangia bacterium]
MATKHFSRGRYFEDFEVGAVYRHHWGRTITEGENALFSTWTMNVNPIHFNREHARALGYETTPVNQMLVMNVVFGLSVEDLSEKAIAHLGYWKMRFGKPVFPGDTLFSESEVLGKRPSESKDDRGIVHVRTRGYNQREELVIEYERRILVKKRASHAAP